MWPFKKKEPTVEEIIATEAEKNRKRLVDAGVNFRRTFLKQVGGIVAVSQSNKIIPAKPTSIDSTIDSTSPFMFSSGMTASHTVTSFPMYSQAFSVGTYHQYEDVPCPPPYKIGKRNGS